MDHLTNDIEAPTALDAYIADWEWGKAAISKTGKKAYRQYWARIF